MSNSKKINTEYLNRINKVLDYIENNLNSTLSLEEMASVANFSVYHFHRIFLSIVGETPVQYQRRKRLELSANDLYKPETTIKDLSSKYGFPSPAVYSRDFKKYFGEAPISLRKKLLSRFANIDKVNVEVKTVHPFKFAYNSIVGFNQIVPGYNRLQKALRQNKVKPGKMVEYILDNQYITPIDKCRYEIGFIVPEHSRNLYDLKDTKEQKYAIYKLNGRIKDIDISFDKLYSWIIRSSYEPDNSPLKIVFNRVFSLRPFLPLDYTNAEVCVPIKKQEMQSK